MLVGKLDWFKVLLSHPSVSSIFGEGNGYLYFSMSADGVRILSQEPCER